MNKLKLGILIAFVLLCSSISLAAGNINVTIVTPSAGYNYTYNTSIPLNYLAQNTTICQYSLDWAPNVTMTSCVNATFNASEGAHVLVVYVNNSQNVNSSSVLFTVDLTAPALTISSPTNMTYNYNTSIPLTYLVTNSGLNATRISKCWYNVSGANVDIPSCVNTSFNVSTGFHTLFLYANDTAGNNGTSNITFSIDLVYPTINLTLPTNTTYTSTNISINYTATDNGAISQCWYTLNGGTAVVMTNCTNAIALANQGSNNVSVYANDTAGNTNNTNAYFTVDSIVPSITINAPTNTSYTSTNRTINYTVTDSGHPISACWFSINTTVNNTLANCANTTVIAPQGSTTVTVYSNDTAGNINSTQVSITVDSIAPNITINAPTNTTYTSTNLSINYIVLDSVHPIDKCWFSVNTTVNNTQANCANATVIVPQGSTTLTIYANDTVGNENNTVTVSFTITTTTSTTTTTTLGGSSGGGATVTPHKFMQKWIKMLKGVVHKIMMFDKEIGFKQIIIEVRNNANNITITITKLAGQPATVVHNITGKVYQYMEIDHDNLNNSNLKSAKLRFNVTKIWINGNNFTKEHIYLNRYSNNVWEKLRTTIVGESSTEVEYEAETPGFSTFAITGEAVETTTTTIPIIPMPEVTTTTTTTVPVAPPETPSVPAEYYKLYMLILLLVIIAVLGWLYFHGNKKLPLFKHKPIHE